MEEDKLTDINPGGRPRIFESPDEMAHAIQEYFNWWRKNQYAEEKIFQYEGKLITGSIKKMRPLTVEGLAIHLGITVKTFYNYCDRPEFLHITTRARDIIENQQYEGAAAGFLQPNIVARKLGLSDKVENTMIEQPLFTKKVKK